METNIVVDISPIPYLAIFWFSSYGPKCCEPIKLQLSLKCNISRKKLMMKCIFGMQINIKVFWNLMPLFLGFATRHAQSTHNKEYAYHWSISRKAWGGGEGGEVDFLPAYRHESFLQVDSMTLGFLSQACPKYQKQVCNISRKMRWTNLIFCVQINVKGFLTIIILRVCDQACPNYPK